MKCLLYLLFGFLIKNPITQLKEIPEEGVPSWLLFYTFIITLTIEILFL